MYRIAIVCCFTAFMLVHSAGMTATAQVMPRQPREGETPRPPGDVKDVKIKGTIKGIRGELMYVANGEGQAWMVKMPAGPRAIHMVGNAVPTWLQPGMLVRFSGIFDADGKPQAPIERVEVFTYRPPREGQQPELPGVFPEAALVGAEIFQEANAAALATQSYIIIGQLRGFKDDAITVAAGPTMVQAKLAVDAEIVVDLADYRFARLGDEIDVTGWHYPLIKTQVYANHVTIRAAEPIGKELTVKPPVPNTPPGTNTPTPKKPSNDDLPF